MQMENLHTFATVECADEHANNATKNIHEYIRRRPESINNETKLIFP